MKMSKTFEATKMCIQLDLFARIHAENEWELADVTDYLPDFELNGRIQDTTVEAEMDRARAWKQILPASEIISELTNMFTCQSRKVTGKAY